VNLNKILVPDYRDTESNDICLRGKVDTGYRCNYKCYFCYYKNNLDDPFLDKKIIKHNIDNLISRGIKEIEFSGGESSIHPNIIELIEYAYNKCGKVSMLSNGSFDNKLLANMKQKGLSEILFSVHGWSNQTHDAKVGVSGAFTKLLDSIYYAQQLGIIIRVNCTIENKLHVSKYKTIIKLINPKQVNLLPLNYWNNAQELKEIDYLKVSNNIKKLIDSLKTYQFEINVRYIPFCFMKGYEPYVKSTYSHIFDKTDWNIQTYGNIEERVVSKEYMFLYAFRNRKDTYIKPKECINCKWIYICDGIENKLLNSHKLNKVIGNPIKDINKI